MPNWKSTTPGGALSTMTTTSYRVVRTTKVGFGEDAELSQDSVWQGADTKVLSKMYPPSEIFGADELGHSEIEGGHIRFDYTFEQLVEGKWHRIDDPRVRLTPVTDLEREIDAENRRLFPGDFEQDDPDDYNDFYGYYCDTCHNHGCSECEPEEVPEPVCEECGMDPCYCDMIAEHEAEAQQEDYCPNCGGDQKTHAERACSKCGECICDGYCNFVYTEMPPEARCYFCGQVDCQGGCDEEKDCRRLSWSRLRHFWRLWYKLRS